MKYIHYGHNKFDINSFVDVKNQEMFNKPIGGLWASPINAKHSWKEWCKSQNFRECNDGSLFTFELKESTNIYYLNCKNDVLKLPMINNKTSLWSCPDFEKIRKQGIDAIQYNLSDDTTEDYYSGLYYTLYGWDCDCILVLNKDCIK